MIQEPRGGAALPNQVAGRAHADAGAGPGGGFHARADGAVEPAGLISVHHLLLLGLGVEHHLLVLVLLGGHVGRTREVGRRRRRRRRRRLVVPDVVVVVGQEPGDDVVGAVARGARARSRREQVLAEVAEHRAGRRSVA